MNECIVGVVIFIVIIIGFTIYKSYYNETFVNHTGETCETYAHKTCVNMNFPEGTPNHDACIKGSIAACRIGN